MRILHVSDCYWPRLGGIEIHLRDLVVHQRAAGDDALVVTTSPPPLDGTPDDPWVHRLVRPAPLQDLLGKLRPDAVHVHVSVFSPFATRAARQASSLGLPTAVTVHSMWSRLGPLPAAACSLLRLRSWPIAWSAVSERAAEPLRVMLGPGIPVSVLPNAVEPDRWTGRTWPGSTPVIPAVISVTRMTHTKRTLPLARILRDVRRRVPAEQPLRAVVVGDGPQRPALERYLRRHRMDWVELPGRLDRPAIRQTLVDGAVYLAPAELESFGIAALEARTAGLPVVASSLSGVGEFITHGTEGLLGASDDVLAAHVARLVTDESLRSAITRHNVTVPPVHDWTEARRRTNELYVAAAAANARAGRPGNLSMAHAS
jgi:glycosyltransferase involved in cell wall biosynthesis